MDSTDLEPRAKGLAATMAHMPTGAKVFLILVGALLPLALIALLTTLQTTRTADTEARARLRAIADESSGVVENALTNQVGQMSQTLAALEQNPNDAPSCTQRAGTFAAQGSIRFAIADKAGRVLCGQRFTLPGASALRPSEVRVAFLPDGLAIRIGGNAGMSATAYYPVSTLAALARPSGFVPDYGAALVRRDERLALRALGTRGPLGRRERIASNLSIDSLDLEMSMPGAPITTPLIITTALLVLMWIAAATIA